MNNPFINLKSSPIIKNASENICNNVFTLDNFVTFKFDRSFGAESLNPETRTSLIIIINDGKAEFSKNISQSLTKVQIPYLNRKGISVFLDAKVIRNDNRYGITIIETGIGRLSIPECQFEVGQRFRVRILSDDVSITLSKSKDSSISNIFKVKVKKIASDSKHMKIITLESGSTQIKARITKKSSAILNLELNDEVFAQIKTVATTY